MSKKFNIVTTVSVAAIVLLLAAAVLVLTGASVLLALAIAIASSAIWAFVYYQFMCRYFQAPINNIQQHIKAILNSTENPSDHFWETNTYLAPLTESLTDLIQETYDTRSKLEKKISESIVVNEVARACSSILDLDEVLRLIIILALEELRAQKASLMLLDDSKTCMMIKMAIGDDNTNLRNRCIKIGEGIAGWVAEHGEPLLIKDVTADTRFSDSINKSDADKYANNSLLSVPLIEKGEVIGVLNVNNKSAGELFNEDDRDLLMTLVSQAATSIVNARLYEKQLAAKQLEREMEIAHDIQMNLLPSVFPPIPGHQISAFSIPAKQVGGDYYDVLPIKIDGYLGFTIADVSGKGIPAALLMIMCRIYLRSQAMQDLNTARVLRVVNEMILSDKETEAGLFITLFYAVYNIKENELYYSNAGHDPPLLFRSKDNSVESLSSGDLFLGAFANIQYKRLKKKLYRGDVLLFYTDGIVEAANSAGVLYGEERLIELVQKNITLSAEHLKDCIFRSVQDYVGDRPQGDDITLMVFKLDDDYDEQDDICALVGRICRVVQDHPWFDSVKIDSMPKIRKLISKKYDQPDVVDEIESSCFFNRDENCILNDEVTLAFKMQSRLAYVDLIDVLAMKIAQNIHLDDNEVSEFIIGIKEALINAIKYGCKDNPDGEVEISFSLINEEIRVVVRDYGEGMDTSRLRDPRNKDIILADHGRGILMMRSFMNTLDISSVPGEGTTVVMTKKHMIYQDDEDDE